MLNSLSSPASAPAAAPALPDWLGWQLELSSDAAGAFDVQDGGMIDSAVQFDFDAAAHEAASESAMLLGTQPGDRLPVQSPAYFSFASPQPVVGLDAEELFADMPHTYLAATARTESGAESEEDDWSYGRQAGMTASPVGAASEDWSEEWEPAVTTSIGALAPTAMDCIPPPAFAMQQASMLPEVEPHSHSHAHSHSLHLAAPVSSGAASAPPVSQVHGGASAAPLKRAEKRSCISCRRLKVHCDDMRPCKRCTKAGRECIDRTEEDIQEALQRRKRTSSQRAPPKQKAGQQQHRADSVASGSSASVPSSAASASTVPLFPPASAAVITDVASAQLYSQCQLLVLTQLGMREVLLGVHAQLHSLPPQVALLLQFPIHSNMLLSRLAETLTQTDFATFLTAGLSVEQIASPFYQSSPLAVWLHPSTRPMHVTYESTNPLSESGDLTKAPSVAAQAPATVAHLRTVWLPKAIAAFKRFQKMTHAPSQQFRRVAQPADLDPLSQQAQQLAVTSEAQRRQLLSGLAAEVAALLSEDEVATLGDHICQLSLGRVADAPPSAPQVEAPRAHAAWCPCSQSPHADTHKRQRVSPAAAASNVSTPTSSHSSPNDLSSVGSDADTSCVCEGSVPIPMNVTTNKAHEALFGWSQAEIVQGMMREGAVWLRHLSPPCLWPQLQHTEFSHFKRMFQISSRMVSVIRHKLEVGAAEAGATGAAKSVFLALKDKETAHAVQQPKPHDLHTHLLSKSGQILPCVMQRIVIQSGDAHKADVVGFVSAWTLEEQAQ